MLLTNLLPKPPQNKKRHQAILLGGIVSIIITVALTAPLLSQRHTTETRNMLIEEMSTVLATLDRIERRAPQILRWVASLRESITRDLIPTLVEEASNELELVTRLDNKLVFSGAFFEADTITQEKSLLKIVIDSIPKEHLPEIAKTYPH